MSRPDPYDDLPPVVDITGAAAILDCSKDHIRNLIRRGELRSLRLGKLVRISRTAILEKLGEPVESVAARTNVEPATSATGSTTVLRADTSNRLHLSPPTPSGNERGQS